MFDHYNKLSKVVHSSTVKKLFVGNLSSIENTIFKAKFNILPS